MKHSYRYEGVEFDPLSGFKKHVLIRDDGARVLVDGTRKRQLRREGRLRVYCQHGNETTKYVCPECHNERMKARQVKADRARFKAQMDKIRGLCG